MSQVSTDPGTQPTTTAPAAKPVAATASSAHHALINVAILGAFVGVSTVLAGVNPQLGHGILALMLVILLMQGISHAGPAAEWAANHQY